MYKFYTHIYVLKSRMPVIQPVVYNWYNAANGNVGISNTRAVSRYVVLILVPYYGERTHVSRTRVHVWKQFLKFLNKVIITVVIEHQQVVMTYYWIRS